MADVLMTVASLGTVWLIIAAIDARAGDQLPRMMKATVTRHDGVAAHLHQGVAHAARSTWELSHVYGPLMTFAAVALVLVIVMVRTK